ncbi:MBL fold metallo-hydrolase [Opitutia bacterium ISCC 51]|nr:MBL fold metallo-hydrolase [Opitutae bacterium ISCC 51]QXD29345.1 MBL fold metallo-hydrolase [Opitutae bacterium ISCC 52]
MLIKTTKWLAISVTLLASILLGGLNAYASEEADFEVIMLGVGSPPPLMHRFGAGTLIKAGDKYLLVDCGRGVTQRLWQLGVPLGRVDGLFVTHLHSDHVIGIPDLLLTGWLSSPFGGRKGNFNVWGPEGTQSMMDHIRLAYQGDVDIRVKDQGFTLEGVTPNTVEIEAGLIYNQDGVKVTAIVVNHGELIKPAYGYRVDYDGRSVVISGDTKYYPPLAEAAKGTDLFIHAVGAAKPELLASKDSWRVILDHHTEPEDVGRIFGQAQPKMAALYHYVTLTNGEIKPPSLGEISARLKTTYTGPLTMGADLTRFIIGKDKVTVIPPQ